jgi:GT2 family glycosyltransferase
VRDVEFSVIVPAFAAPSEICACLEALAQLHAPPGGFEVVVVDDGSPEPLARVVDAYRGRLHITLQRQSNAGPGRARNAGARVACGRFLAFTDSDCRPAPDWLTVLARQFGHMPRRMLGGRTINQLTKNAYAATSQLIVDVVYAFYNREPESARFFASNNLAVPAVLFQQLGGFNEQFFRHASEDRELCDRWLHAGHRMTFVAEAIVLHAHDLTLATFCRQHFTYGRGAWAYQLLRARRGSGRLRDDMKFYAHLPRLVRQPLRRLPPRLALTILPLLGVWQAANAAGFVYQSFRARTGTDRGP